MARAARWQGKPDAIANEGFVRCGRQAHACEGDQRVPRPRGARLASAPQRLARALTPFAAMGLQPPSACWGRGGCSVRGGRGTQVA